MATTRRIELLGAPFGAPLGAAEVRGLNGADLVLLDATAAATLAARARRLAEATARLEGPADVGALAWSDLQRLLLACCIETFGPRPALVSDCAACGERFEIAADLEAALDAAPARAEPACDLDGAAVGWQARLRGPTVDDMERAAAHAARDRDGAGGFLLDRLVEELTAPDGTRVSVDAAPAPVRAALEAAFEAADAGGLLEVAVACPLCGAVAPRRLDPFVLILREAEMSDDVFNDVARLAAAFGWSAPQILELPQRERRRLLGALASGAPA